MPLLKPTTPDERNLRGWDFFLLWAGAGISLAEIWAGGLLVPLGFLGGLLAIVLGHVIGNTPMALGGIIGSRQGVPAMVSTRGALGNRGSLLPAILNVVQLAGWTAVMIWIAGHAAAQLTPGVAWLNGRAWIVIVGAVTTAWALVGHGLWKWLQRVAVALLLGLSVFMTWVVVRQYGFRQLFSVPPKPGLPFMLGVDLVIAMPISWLPLAADYSRFARSTRSSFRGTWWGYFAGSCWMYAVGLAAALATQADNPDGMVLGLMSSLGFALPALAIILLSTFTTTFLDIYSNAVSVQSIFPRAGERAVVLAGGVLGTALAAFFPAQEYETFLLLIGSAFCPLFGIVLADYFILHRMNYHAEDLFLRGRYWFLHGVNPAAVIAWVLGLILYQASARHGWLVGASLPSLLGAAALYVALMALGRGKHHADTEAAEP